MLSKKQFVGLVVSLKRHKQYEDKFNKAISLLNTSHTVLELAPNLYDGIMECLSTDFSVTGMDILFDYIYEDNHHAIWLENDNEFNIKIESDEQLYEIMKQYFSL